MPSELVNSVISSPHPPSPRITRRKSVSVTPAMGARTAAGAIVKLRIWKLVGSIGFSLGLCARPGKMRLDPSSAAHAPDLKPSPDLLSGVEAAPVPARSGEPILRQRKARSESVV